MSLRSSRPTERLNKRLFVVIYNSLEFVPQHTSYVVKKEIDVDDRDCLLAVSNAVPIVSPEWLDSAKSTLVAFEGRQNPEGIFELPAPDEFSPAIDSGIDDARGKASWWLPDATRKAIWKGKTVLTLGGKSVSVPVLCIF